MEVAGPLPIKMWNEEKPVQLWKAKSRTYYCSKDLKNRSNLETPGKRGGDGSGGGGDRGGAGDGDGSRGGDGGGSASYKSSRAKHNRGDDDGGW